MCVCVCANQQSLKFVRKCRVLRRTKEVTERKVRRFILPDSKPVIKLK